MKTSDIYAVKLKLFIFVLIAILSCKDKKAENNKIEYKLISYLSIPVDSLGNLPRNPYVLQYKQGKKELLVIGTQHTSDTSNPMYAIIENMFYDFKPEIIINEGGDLTKSYTDKNAAILANNELGLEKYLADKAGIKTMNGDEPLQDEIQELTNLYSKEEALLFLASERFVFPYIFGQYSGDVYTEYKTHFIDNYMLKYGVSLNENEQSWDYYTTVYKKYFSKEFSMDSISQFDFTPFSKRHHFCDVTRSSKECRDKYLLRQIENQLELHQKVMLVYGGWHILAIEPALLQIMNKYKNSNE